MLAEPLILIVEDRASTRAYYQHLVTGLGCVEQFGLWEGLCRMAALQACNINLLISVIDQDYQRQFADGNILSPRFGSGVLEATVLTSKEGLDVITLHLPYLTGWTN